MPRRIASPGTPIERPAARRGGRPDRARDMLVRMVNAYGAHRYAALFYTVLLTLAAAPLLTGLHFSADVLQIFLAFNLLVALLDVPQPGWRLILTLLMAVVVGLRAAPPGAVGTGLSTGALVVASGVALLAAGSAVRFAGGARVIGAEQIYAALSAYLLAGLFFGVLHWAIAIAWPGSYGEAGADFPLGVAIYYSFVTLATLGYGDVVPRSDMARGIAVIEAVGGQLYIAVMIARLVGAQHQTPEADGTRGARGEQRPAPAESSPDGDPRSP